jgi:hypothetical protein
MTDKTNAEKNAFDESLERVKCEIRHDMRTNRVPYTVKTLGELAWYVQRVKYFHDENLLVTYELELELDKWLSTCSMEDKREGPDYYHEREEARPVAALADQPDPDTIGFSSTPAPLTGVAARIFDAVIAAMRHADAAGAPEGEDYLHLMGRIVDEATTRSATYREVLAEEARQKERA